MYTVTPWYATGIHVQSAAINEDNYVCTAEGDSPERAIANADLIVKAVNNYDALVAAMRHAHQSLRTFSPYVPEDEQGWTSFDSDALEVIEKALSLCKE